MKMEPYFQKALSNMVFETACGASIRSMVDRGCTTKQIAEQLDYPMSIERVARAVTDYMLERDILRRKPPDMGESKESFTYVQEKGKFGKTSFRKVVQQEKEGADRPWNKEAAEDFLKEKRDVAAYVPCDFGLPANEGEADFSVLNDRQREFLSGICWERRRMYYRLDKRMEEIIRKLWENGVYSGDVYWREK